MAFALSRFCELRPFLFHLTDQRNVSRISRMRCLESASDLINLAKQPAQVLRKRFTSLSMCVDGENVWIRDQAPLHAGNVGFQDGWSFEDLIRCLNEKVFFWPGTQGGPISYGVRHFQRYQAEGPALMRISSSHLLAANSKLSPYFCRYNSGSPRCSKGIRSPRGPSTFVDCDNADFSPASVVEVVFQNRVVLPDCTEVSQSFEGPWTPMFHSNRQ